MKAWLILLSVVTFTQGAVVSRRITAEERAVEAEIPKISLRTTLEGVVRVATKPSPQVQKKAVSDAFINRLYQDDGRLDFEEFLGKSQGFDLEQDQQTTEEEEEGEETEQEEEEEEEKEKHQRAPKISLPGFGPGFTGVPVQNYRKLSRSALRGLFNRLDVNRNGYVDLGSELDMLVQDIRAADRDASGKVSFLEFSAGL